MLIYLMYSISIFHAEMAHAEFFPTYVAFQGIDVGYDSCLHILKLVCLRVKR